MSSCQSPVVLVLIRYHLHMNRSGIFTPNISQDMIVVQLHFKVFNVPIDASSGKMLNLLLFVACLDFVLIL